MLTINQVQNQMEEIFGKPISTYSRAEAIEDGVLIDVTEEAKKCGFKYPVAVTSALWGECLVPSDHCQNLGESERGRMRDMFTMLHWALNRKSGPRDEIKFAVKFGRQNHGLKAICGPGDTPEPVITIMLEGGKLIMKPSVIIGGKKAIYNPDQNRLTIKFFFPKIGGGETGEIDLINGDVPQIIVMAPESVQVTSTPKKKGEHKRKSGSGIRN